MPDTRQFSLTSSEDSVLHNKGYRLQKILGEGSYAKVYLSDFKQPHRAAEKSQPSKLACKIIDTTKLPEDFTKKFLPRELDILIRINHPHIIHIHSIFQRKSKYFIFMRFAELGDVLEFVHENGALTEQQARVWFKQVALAIQYLHELEIAHRDLKCENVLITSNFNVKLADFGFAREIVDSQARRIMSETYCGSLAYTAPEILKGVPYLPKNADVWSCGVILYVLLNKAMPFDDSNVKKLLQFQMNRQWNFRPRIIQAMSYQVKSLMNRMLEPDASKRYTINEVLNSEWYTMEPNMTALTVFEADALVEAVAQRQLRFGNVDAYKKMTAKREEQAAGVNDMRQLRGVAEVRGMKSARNKAPPNQRVDSDNMGDIPAERKLGRK